MAYSDYGSKPYPNWKNEDFKYPGYHNAVLEFKNVKNGSIVNQGFLVSPSSFTDQRINNAQPNKTTAGWVVYRTGKGLGTISFGGIVLDTLNTPERLTFIKRFTQYAEDGYNDKFETKNDWLQSITIEGVKYEGYIQNISFQKNGQSPFVYQYTISFLVYSDTIVHQLNKSDSKSEDAMDILSGAKKSSRSSSDGGQQSVKKLASSLYNMLT